MLTPRRLLVTDGSPPALAALTLQERADQTILWATPALSAAQRSAIERQAAHFGVDRVVGPGLEPASDRAPASPRTIAEGRMLFDALLAAWQCRCGRIIWPCQAGHDLDRIAQVQEIVLCVGHVARLDPAWRTVGPEIRTPLLDCTDEQVADLIASGGGGMALAWWCEGPAAAPCGGCGACRRWSAVNRLAAA